LDLVETPPAPRYQGLASVHVRLVQAPLVKVSLHADRLKIFIHNELGQGRVASQVPLPRRVQDLRLDHPDYVPQIKIAVRDRLHVLPAHLAQVSLFALRHGT
jgi:hypothetical protein